MSSYLIKIAAQAPGDEDWAGQHRAQQTAANLAAFLNACAGWRAIEVRDRPRPSAGQPVPSPTGFPARAIGLTIHEPVADEGLKCRLNDTWNSVKQTAEVTVENEETGTATNLSF
ncbi:uncharacterized protein KD926_004333 [Aspergillus affinis]|uniref:uncharacterized protein n=1 Tax=Aspergillus affinis TaxID=1070780 RepID=UPI0022FE6610|nr:uncharacterized protein KD926_004333 [Aspergillus affinis]KAI9043150.1 hypothetical protein KD926_004333 [Aspergillus affinis]